MGSAVSDAAARRSRPFAPDPLLQNPPVSDCSHRGTLAWVAITLVVSTAILCPARFLRAQEPAGAAAQHDNRTAKATSSRAARQSAVRSIPFDKLQLEWRQKAVDVIQNTTVFRRMPLQVIDCDPELYLYLADNPDMVVDIWEVLGVSQIALRRTGLSSFEADDGEGTLGTIEYLYRDHETHVIYCEGKYEGHLIPRPVRGRCLLVLKSGYVRETNDRYYITCRLDAFVCLDHMAAEVLAKTFQPLIGKVADYNFLETTAFLASMSRTAEVNPDGVRRLVGRLDGVSPEARRHMLLLCDRINVEASIAQTAARQTTTPERK